MLQTSASWRVLFFPTIPQPCVDVGFFIVEVSQSHSETPHSVGLLWTSDQPVRNNLYLKTHNTHNRQTSMLPAGLKPGISASEQSPTQALDRATTGTGCKGLIQRNIPVAISYPPSPKRKYNSIYSSCLLISKQLFRLARRPKTVQEERPSY
jgi:hypothetical protein